MKKTLLFIAIIVITNCFAQTDKLWKPSGGGIVTTSKNIERLSFPKNVQLYELNIGSLKQILLNAPDRFVAKKGAVITLPNVDGKLEQFEVFEASNFDPALQAQFPDIRSYAGRSLEDKYAQLRLSISPQGIQTMVFRTDRRNEFMEPYSADGTVYAVYNSSRNKGSLPFTCLTEDKVMAESLQKQVSSSRAGTSELLTFRLALSCNGEYATYHGGTVAGALAGMNATMTRVNGVFEKDFAIHMNLIANNTAVIFTNAATDPYSTTLANWNVELQNTLTNTVGVGNGAYDVGHMFGATGGGGNAGCIGCVCVDDTASTTDKNKGAGITSPADGIPMGDNFDIDYVAHEMGHQFGGNHTFSMNIEGTGVNVEPGSGSTIMGYAGITGQDVQMHSDDYFVYATINQVDINMAGKSCPTRTPLTNGAPVMNAGLNYTIPKSTPFVLTGSGTDPNGNPITYCWEQNDSATTESGALSTASATKVGGPNWRSYNPVSSPSRYFPPLSAVIANAAFTTAVSDDATPIKNEYLSSVARTLDFTLTGRDNVIGGGLTGTDAMVVTVNGTAGPFLVSSPNTAVSWGVGTNQTVTWAVAGTTANGVNAAYVDIYLSVDGGNTYPILLAGKVPNDGTETVTIPNNVGTTNRIMIKGNNHVFFDISNTNFTITAPASTFAVAFSGIQGEQNKAACQGTNVSYNIDYKTLAGFSGTTTFSATGSPGGSTVTFSPSSITTNGTVVMTISNTIGSTAGFYSITVNANSGATTKSVPLYFELYSTVSAMVLTSPANLAYAQSTSPTLNWVADAAATSYDVQVATDSAFSNIIRNVNVLTNSYSLTGLSFNANYFWRVLPKNASCSGVYSSPYRFTTGQVACNTFSATNVPVGNIPVVIAGATITSKITIPAGSEGTITDVNITAQITYSRTTELTITLISPLGTRVLLAAAKCGNNPNVNATFDDSGVTLVCGTDPTIAGTITPTQALSALNGQSSLGDWKLEIIDSSAPRNGTLDNWSINICSIPNQPVTCGQITTTWNGTSWSNGKPLDNVAATINGNYTSSGNLDACSLNVSGTAQVTFLSGHNLTVDGAVNVAGTASLTIESNANLIQTQNVSNIGNIKVKRNTASLMRQDYVLWSSPVAGQQLQSFSPLTLATRFYTYSPSTNLYVVVPNPTASNFTTGNGFLIRMPNNHPVTPTIWSGTFTGVPNNGNVNLTVANATYNAIGNPYPSTINANTFITTNGITEALYFWRKTNNAATTSYATYTLAGGVGTGSNSGDPLGLVPSGIIQVGQGFIAKSTSTNLAFTNSMRIANNANQFLKTTEDRHRVWLNLTNTGGLFSQTMVAYMPDATLGIDDAIDGRYFNDSQTALTSVVNNEEFAIQGRPLPFDASDVVPLGFKSELAGNYTIALDHFDGLFTGSQAVLLKDNLTNITHDLRAGSYDFASAAGVFNTRFEIIYQDLLNVNLPDFNENSVIVYKSNGSIHINSGAVMMDNVKIFDISGRLLTEKSKINTTQTTIDSSRFGTQVLIVQITSDAQIKVNKKVVN